ncbi:MAG: hypothetical protein FWF23_00855 [Alphaproteobacteria bacterium]|nr:hypothetical protein [Alphaproteobacteria bacterium]MCL2505755.1 hypothetical protein [Alphaproteobacteria bacterium]
MYQERLPYERIPLGNTLSTLTLIFHFALLFLLTVPVYANTTPNLCKAGTVIDIEKSGDSWTWTCQGKYGGTSKACSGKVIDGACICEECDCTPGSSQCGAAR